MNKTIYLTTERETITVLTPEGEKQVPFDFNRAVILKSLFSQDPVNGYTIDEMRLRFKILEKLDEANGEVEFSEEERAIMVQRLGTLKFQVASKEYIKLIDDLS